MKKIHVNGTYKRKIAKRVESANFRKPVDLMARWVLILFISMGKGSSQDDDIIVLAKRRLDCQSLKTSQVLNYRDKAANSAATAI
jgi:hypothetical protein